MERQKTCMKSFVKFVKNKKPIKKGQFNRTFKSKEFLTFLSRNKVICSNRPKGGMTLRYDSNFPLNKYASEEN